MSKYAQIHLHEKTSCCGIDIKRNLAIQIRARHLTYLACVPLKQNTSVLLIEASKMKMSLF